MKLKIKADKHNIFLWLPTSLLKSRLVYNIIKCAIRNDAKKKDKPFEMPFDRQQQLQLYKALKQCIKDNGHFNLVEVESHDGERVLIRV